MRILIVPIALLLLVSCGQSDKKTSDKDQKQTLTQLVIDTERVNLPTGVVEVNRMLNEKGEGKWHVVTDKETGWMPDVFDYFVVPERKKNPEYPFIARGDFNCDKKNDIAALVTDSAGKETRLVFFLGDD